MRLVHYHSLRYEVRVRNVVHTLHSTLTHAHEVQVDFQHRHEVTMVGDTLYGRGAEKLSRYAPGRS